MGVKRSLTIVIFVSALASFITSYLLHYPEASWRIYSDIFSFWFRPLVREIRVPYVQEPFEYPPMAGLITYISALIGGGQLIPYYNMFSAILLFFYLLLVYVTLRVMREKNVSTMYLFMYLIFAPTTIVYLNYNFDVVFAAFLMLTLLFFEKERYTLSALMFSAAALAKFMSFLLLPLLLPLLRDKRRILTYLLYAILPFAMVNVLLQVLNPNFFKGTFLYHAEWVLENAWFVYLFPSRDSWDTAKLFSASLMAYGLLKVYLSDVGNLYERTFMILAVFLLTNYVFTPQMVLWLLPLLAVIGRLQQAFYVLEVANVGIILTWFTVPDPLAPGTTPQNLALLRALMLFTILIETYLAAANKETLSQKLERFFERFYRQGRFYVYGPLRRGRFNDE